MKPTYRQSSISTYLRCGLQYWFRYVEGLKQAPSGAQIVGSATHKAIASNFVQKKEDGLGLSLEHALEIYSEDFEDKKLEVEWQPDEDAGKAKDIGIQCVTVHHKEIAPLIIPDVVEEQFILETDAGYDLSGTLDLADSNRFIRDAKTSKGAYKDDDVSRALQPALYDFAYESLRGVKAKGFAYDVMIKPTKKIPARSQIVTGRVTKRDREWAFENIAAIHKGIQAGVFLPAPEDVYWCSKKFCGYWGICKGKAK